jgi:leucyl-tRNA synthetase
MKNIEYNHLKIEKAIQKEWAKNTIYKTEQKSKKKPFYVLDMFPYPSGAGLHVGHPRGYIGSDVYARFKRMQGFNVLHPMGFDAFGLPAEQYAVQTGKHPSIITKAAIKRYKSQLEQIGFSYDWSREVQTIDPEYYKWTQVIFLKIYNSFFDIKKQKARHIEELVAIFEKEGNRKINEYTAHSDVEVFSKIDWKNFSPKEKQDVLMKYRIAYEGYAEVNWCAELGTVLANDEVLEKDGKLVSERGDFPVEKKSMRQWFMRISAYGDRLISGLDLVDFEQSTKETQKNWIGKSVGSEIEFKTTINRTIKVFTTRADTLFGVTYVVLSPEHKNIGEFLVQSKNMAEVSKYVREAKEKMKGAETEGKEKTGVCLEGVFAINPVNGEQVSVWVGDYVLASYGTGAVMAVPAHDERDFEFAKKYNLPIKKVIEPLVVDIEGDSAIAQDLPFIKRDNICVVLRNPKNDTYLVTNWKNHNMHGLVTGGIDKGEDIVECAKREILEETGYKNIIFTFNPNFAVQTKFFHRVKKENRWARYQILFFDLLDEQREEVCQSELDIHELLWKNKNELKTYFSVAEGIYSSHLILDKNYIFTDYGILVDCGEFTGFTSEKAKKEITEFVGGKLVTKYKMRDAIFARQRYWGEPIPLQYIDAPLKVFFLKRSLKKDWENSFKKYAIEIISKEGWDISVYVEKKDIKHFIPIAQKYLENGPFYFDISGSLQYICYKDKIFDLSKKGENEKAKIYGRKLNINEEQLDWQEGIKIEKLIKEVKEKDLPLKLPNVKSYKPTGTGESPLAGVASWVNAGYETNTMPGWAGSSWYFLRYMDPKNKKALVGDDAINYYKNVDMYVGGTEHNTGHLLYARFWHKVLFDLGITKTQEPFKALRHQGMIGGADGRKMSKRWGNVINPDDVVKTYGADTLRIFEMFLGPFDAHLPWSEDGIIGSRRFVERVWRVSHRVGDFKASPTDHVYSEFEKILHKTIKKVTDDIEAFAFNTAISSLMICLNSMEKQEVLLKDDFKKFLQILAPFAPHMTDELWHVFGEKTSVHLSPWPTYNPKFLIESKVTIGIQVNGKVRGEVTVEKDMKKAGIQALVLLDENVQKYVTGPIKKFIYIPGKIISIVV